LEAKASRVNDWHNIKGNTGMRERGTASTSFE
jgi:hypothetical protein